jgi:uncharacterized protein YnzC (UPF0291/DUF896 family)
MKKFNVIELRLKKKKRTEENVPEKSNFREKYIEFIKQIS